MTGASLQDMALPAHACAATWVDEEAVVDGSVNRDAKQGPPERALFGRCERAGVAQQQSVGHHLVSLGGWLVVTRCGCGTDEA